MNSDMPFLSILGNMSTLQKERPSRDDSEITSHNRVSFLDESCVSYIIYLLVVPSIVIVLQLLMTINQRQDQQHSSNLHYPRRIQHALTGLLFYGLSYILSRPIAITLLCISSISFYAIHRARSLSTKIQQQFLDLFGPLLREYEKNVETLPGAFWFLCGTTVVVCCFPMNIARTSILCLALGDPIAAIVGIQVGGPKIYRHGVAVAGAGAAAGAEVPKKRGNKSIAGCMACFWTCYLVSVACMKQYGPKLWFLTGFVATCMEVLESFCSFAVVDDNLLIPVGTGTVLWCYTHFA